jgi:hypothetical protein
MISEELEDLKRELDAKPGLVSYGIRNAVTPRSFVVHILSNIDYISKDRLYYARERGVMWPVRSNEALSLAFFRDVVLHPYNSEAIKNPAIRVVVGWSEEAVHWIAQNLDSPMDVVLRCAEGDVPANTVVIPRARRDVLVRSWNSAHRALNERARLLALMHLKVFKLKDGDRAISWRVCEYMGACAYDVRVATRNLPPLLQAVNFRYDGTGCIEESVALAHGMEGGYCAACDCTTVREEVYEPVRKKVEEMWLEAMP